MSRIRVLLCDDAPGFRALMRLVLQEDPDIVVVGEAGDGDEGVRAVADLRPDVVLIDLAMPRLDGLAAIERIRRRAPGVRIVVLSGAAPGERAAGALAQGADAYVRKGGDLRAVREAVRAAVAGREPPREPRGG